MGRINLNIYERKNNSNNSRHLRKPLLIVIFLLVILLFSIILFLVVGENNGESKTVLENTILVYGESINLPEGSYYLLPKNWDEKEASKKINIEIKKSINSNNFMKNLDVGSYYVEDKKGTVKYLGADLSFYSFRRNNLNYLITITKDEDDNLIISKKEEVLPDDVYDIVLDPGHGGKDPGAIVATQKEGDKNLEISLVLYEKLQALGYKVYLTRSEDINPGNLKDKEKYGVGGRVSVAYDKSPKLYLSLHCNAGDYSGFEIYSSVRSDLDFSQVLGNNLKKVQNISQNPEFGPKDDLGSHQRESDILKGSDYYYIIKETGGLSTLDEPTQEENNYAIGAETYILELGYLTDQGDLKDLQKKAYLEALCGELLKSIKVY